MTGHRWHSYFKSPRFNSRRCGATATKGAPDRGSGRGSGWGSVVLALAFLSSCRSSPTTPGGPSGPVTPAAGQKASAQPQGRTVVATGAGHSCALRPSGDLECWGDNRAGQLGDGSTRSRERSGPVRGIRGLIDVQAGRAHTCAIDQARQLWCWGDNRHGQLGLGSASMSRSLVPQPSQVRALSGVIALDVGAYHTCALTDRQELFCWGDNQHGQAGQAQGDIIPNPSKVSGIDRVKAVATGRAHSCALRSDGVLLCWGANNYGQLGDRAPAGRYRPRPVNGMGRADAVAAGGDQSCAVHSGGVMCWGRIPEGEHSPFPYRVATTGKVSALSVAAQHACVLDESGRAHCWGTNHDGRLGDASTRSSSDPRPIAELRQLQSISAGDRHTCGADPAGRVYCWGSDGFAALGQGATQARPSRSGQPMSALLLDPSVDVAAGHNFACALADDGGVHCWGANKKGQLGSGSRGAASASPERVLGLNDATRIVAGASHACALRKTGHVVCWGGNEAGQLGHGNARQTYVREPRTVAKVQDVVDIAAGDDFSCALGRDTRVYCWGSRERGQIGHASGGFAPVSGLANVVAIQAGGQHACAIDRSSQVYCWGDNRQGQVGSSGGARSLATAVDRANLVRNLRNVRQLALGSAFSCALLTDTKVRCWGHNTKGQMGNATATDVWMMPVPVKGSRGVSQIGAGREHACSDRGGNLYCWGQVPMIQGSTRPARIPIKTVPLRSAKLDGGAGFHCALAKDGDVACWGANQSGQLGAGNRGYLETPRVVPGFGG